MRGKDMHEGVFQTGLMRHLRLGSRGRPRGVIDGRATEGVVQDQRPAGRTFVVLPQPGRELVEVQKPHCLLVSSKRSLVEFRKEFRVVRSHFVEFSTGGWGRSY